MTEEAARTPKTRVVLRWPFFGLWSTLVAVLSFWLASWYMRSPLSMYSEANRVAFESLEFANELRQFAPADGKPVPLTDIAQMLGRPEFSHLRKYGFKPFPEGQDVIAALVVNQHFEVLFFGRGQPSVHNRNINLE